MSFIKKYKWIKHKIIFINFFFVQNSMFIHWFLKTKNRNKPNSKYQIFMFGYSVSIPPLRNNITPEIISYLDRDFFSSKNMLCQLDHGIVAFTNGLFEVIKASHLVLGDSHSTLKMKKHSLIKISQWTRYMLMIFNILLPEEEYFWFRIVVISSIIFKKTERNVFDTYCGSSNPMTSWFRLFHDVFCSIHLILLSIFWSHLCCSGNLAKLHLKV